LLFDFAKVRLSFEICKKKTFFIIFHGWKEGMEALLNLRENRLPDLRGKPLAGTSGKTACRDLRGNRRAL
jgi:hypothetical protein